MTTLKRPREQSQQKQLYQQGARIFKMVPEGSKHSVSSLISWFNDQRHETTFNHEAWDSLLSNLVGGETLDFNKDDVEAAIKGVQYVPFIQTFRTMMTQNKRRPTNKQLTTFDFHHYNRNKPPMSLGNAINGYYDAGSSKVRKQYVSIIHDLMKQGVDILFRPYKTQQQRTTQSQTTFRLHHVKSSPLYWLCEENMFDLVHDLALVLDTKELHRMDMGLTFIIDHLVEDEAMEDEHIRQKLSHERELIAKELRRRVGHSRRRLTHTSSHYRSRRQLYQAPSRVVHLPRQSQSQSQQQQQQQQQPWTFSRFLAGMPPSKDLKEAWNMLRRVKPSKWTSVASIVSDLEDLVVGNQVVDEETLDTLLNHMVRHDLLKNTSNTAEDIRQCIHMYPLEKTCRALLEKRTNVKPQVFRKASSAGLTYYDYNRRNFLPSCVYAFTMSGLRETRQKFMNIFLDLIQSGLCKLAFPFDDTGMSQLDLRKKNLEFISASLLFRMAMWQSWSFLQLLACRLDMDTLTRCIEDMEFMRSNLDNKNNKELPKYLSYNDMTINDVKGRLDRAMEIFLNGKEKRQRHQLQLRCQQTI